MYVYKFNLYFETVVPVTPSVSVNCIRKEYKFFNPIVVCTQCVLYNVIYGNTVNGLKTIFLFSNCFYFLQARIAPSNG